jgi:antirestriction protein ArdC
MERRLDAREEGGTMAQPQPRRFHLRAWKKTYYNPVGSYYETVFHELAHWSEVRTDWDHAKQGYAMSELVAEMASSFLATKLDVSQAETLENHAAYLRSWLKAMKGDPVYIFRASTQASKVTVYLLSFVRQPGPVAVG